ncbi:hypothetical protein DYBT9275_05932 [Dyadobacter sp. CECT 9275]|uniref:Por secretion system C-terminal sorting domain-containing protein n=1 Tax=Dyadobacter helix TaxID=2822344 RepID=A0A916NEQ4_9BACT|nr:sialate O-acetylesterase [Dyadobacter sp. CECT 9275]CAG5018116.1 hypothetical protein DYBT9275_05932 [Dyadobacter sp. CECT 9275]
MFLRLKSLSFFLFILFCTLHSHAQITITFPSERAVFQRDNANQARVTLAGNYAGCYDRIEARFVPRQEGQGTPAPEGGGWNTIQSVPQGGNFYGSMLVKGGWYQLEIRGVKGDGSMETGHVERVGVGEVFLVAGQSNATGSNGLGNGPGATDDRVNSVDFQNLSDGIIAPYSEIRVPCPQFVHLDALTKTAPFGNYAWCWGAFGDKMAEALNVPVMVFNAGWGGSSSRNWVESISTTGNTVSSYSYAFPQGLPFGHLRIALNNYIAQMGIRAVLWHQGESDNHEGTSRESHRDQLRRIIQESRDLSGKEDLSWVVARASRYTVNDESRIWQPVIDAQSDVIGLNGSDLSIRMAHVFEGPSTDDYWEPPYRTDNIHFSGEGLTFLANLWKQKLTSGFLEQSTPYMAIPPPAITMAYSSDTEMTLQAPEGWSDYKWLQTADCNADFSTSRQVTRGVGTYKIRVTDSYHNTVFSGKVNVSGSKPAVSLAHHQDKATLSVQTGQYTFMPSECRVISTLTPQGSSPVAGAVLTKIWSETSLPTFKSSAFASRHYIVKPDQNESSATAGITLYFTQADFNQFNSGKTSAQPSLPSDKEDNSAKTNIKIYRFPGIDPAGNGLPSLSYTENPVSIVPENSSWNDVLKRWEISFNTTGFGAFLLGSSSEGALPVLFEFFTGRPTEHHQTELSWKTTLETNASHFEIQRGSDMKQFDTIGEVTAAGDTDKGMVYHFLDTNPAFGINYYRLKQLDLDGSYMYTRVLAVQPGAGETVILYPNPVTDKLVIKSGRKVKDVEILNQSGQLIRTYNLQPDSGALFLKDLPAGIYEVKVDTQVFKILKQ